jgi:hypothetical protein
MKLSVYQLFSELETADAKDFSNLCVCMGSILVV